MTYQTKITTKGQELLALASAGSPITLSEIAVGDGNGLPIIPQVTDIALTNEVFRNALRNLTQDINNPNQFIAEMLIPIESGGALSMM